MIIGLYITEYNARTHARTHARARKHTHTPHTHAAAIVPLCVCERVPRHLYAVANTPTPLRTHTHTPTPLHTHTHASIHTYFQDGSLRWIPTCASILSMCSLNPKP